MFLILVPNLFKSSSAFFVLAQRKKGLNLLEFKVSVSL